MYRAGERGRAWENLVGETKGDGAMGRSSAAGLLARGRIGFCGIWFSSRLLEEDEEGGGQRDTLRLSLRFAIATAAGRVQLVSYSYPEMNGNLDLAADTCSAFWARLLFSC